MKLFAGLLLASLAAAQIPTVFSEHNNPCSGRIISAVVDLSPSCSWTDPHRLRVDAAQALFDYFPLIPYPEVIINDPYRQNVLTVFSIHDEGHENGQQGGAEEIKAVTGPLKEEGAWAWISGTNIASGIEIAMDRQRIIPVTDHQYDTGRDRTAIVVFTDGLDTTHNKRRLMDALHTAQGRGIRVHWATMAVPGVDKETFAKDHYLFDGDGVQFFDEETKKIVTATGGVYGTITDQASMHAFVKKVIDKGATNFDDVCKHGGGPIDNNVTVNGLCSSNSRAMYTYTAANDKETIEFTVDLVSKKNPVTLSVTYENTNTGERTEVKVDRDQPTGKLTGTVLRGQKVNLIISPNGASNDDCSYSPIFFVDNPFSISECFIFRTLVVRDLVVFLDLLDLVHISLSLGLGDVFQFVNAAVNFMLVFCDPLKLLHVSLDVCDSLQLVHLCDSLQLIHLCDSLQLIHLCDSLQLVHLCDSLQLVHVSIDVCNPL
ncbi:hypothetical protein A1Q1_04744 [Trichosporon asahii var. asahii CBS 2479]|uniref:VWFA domain-containing protein n=1 Tax=Trichosporon asahii var. asahii (strain ATCC 90039 / CBS 2479 / JCM 2466 / KCTC 7840 / NBRC 103889/ NCYC 2677 / UAMH 7654) TaxID=1186058 RepID=J5QCN2_TRIAS|nr:hypothetical protein A1Q1_04744 [Trichosporon asahii var. asahii CBS 2479]EJT46673.1 hypothetical protein A1Q1_04744 [Trichosporon asahii var. asahii CBS 2479]